MSPLLSNARRIAAGRISARTPLARAFTLVEMLLVLLFISVISGAAVVSVQGRIGRYALRVNAEDLAASIRFASTESKIKRHPHRVAFQNDHREYCVEAAVGGAEMDFEPVGGLAGRKKRFVDRINIVSIHADGQNRDTEAGELLFAGDQDGFCGSIKLADDGGETIRITVAPRTGQVDVIEKFDDSVD